MENTKKLYIVPHVEEDIPEDIQFKNLGYFYDLKSHICIYRKHIEYDLKVGFVYDFTFEDWEDIDTYCYVVLKKEGNVYYLAEFYNRFIQTKESLLTDDWVKCNVKEILGIDISDWKYKNIYSISSSNWIPVKSGLYPNDMEHVQVTYLRYHDQKPLCNAFAYRNDKEWRWSLDDGVVKVKIVAWRYNDDPYIG